MIKINDFIKAVFPSNVSVSKSYKLLGQTHIPFTYEDNEFVLSLEEKEDSVILDLENETSCRFFFKIISAPVRGGNIPSCIQKKVWNTIRRFCGNIFESKRKHYYTKVY